MSTRANYLFSYTVIPTPDREWGVLKNGTWTGMVGMIVARVNRPFLFIFFVFQTICFLKCH